MRQLPCACFASSPVSIQNKPAPICFSTLIFNFFTFFFSTKLVGTCFVRRAECEKPRRLLRGRARRNSTTMETRSLSVAVGYRRNDNAETGGALFFSSLLMNDERRVAEDALVVPLLGETARSGIARHRKRRVLQRSTTFLKSERAADVFRRFWR